MASQFQIERGVPMPITGKRSTYPFSDMQIGDSFMVPSTKEQAMRIQARMATAAKNAFGKGNFRTSQVDNGVRVWRTA